MPNDPKKCKLCHQERGFVKAHIIPRSFYKEITTPAGKLIDASLHYSTKTRTGIYDEHLVCAECEDRFKIWDDYGFRLLCQEYVNEHYVVDRAGERIAYTFDTVEYDKLKLFFVSVLWRASATTQHFFEGIALGPHENVLREMILAANPGEPNDYSVVVERFIDEEGRKVLFPPCRRRFPDLNVVVLSMAGYRIYIKVDKRPPPRPFEERMLKRDQPLHVSLWDYSTSNEKRSVLHLFQRHVANKAP